MDLRDAFDPPVTAMVLAEGKFGDPGGKTANGVVMHSELFDIEAVIDSTQVDSTVQEALNRTDIPDIDIVGSVAEAIDRSPEIDVLIIGAAPPGRELPAAWVQTIQNAIRSGCDIVSGLHVFFTEDEEWRSLAEEHDVRLFDVRKSPPEEELRVADGSVDEVDADIVLTMGTDCAIGKRTTAYELYREAKRQGRNAAWVATGQTGIMLGAHRGVAVDRVYSDFVSGVVENMIVDLDVDYDIVFVEGQGSLTHRAYSGVTLSILHGAWPDAIVLSADPERDRRVYFEQWPVDGVTAEIEHIERLAETQVAAISTWSDAYEDLDLPVANVYEGGTDELLRGVDAVL